MSIGTVVRCVAILLTLGGAQTGPLREPLPDAVLDDIERRIADVPCIGSLDRWERRYAYKRWMEGTIFHLDTMVIAFVYAEAGKHGFVRGRRFEIDPPPPMIDDRPYRIAYGEVDLKTGQVTTEACGPNVATR